ncbi:MAG TPA: LuxR C-terminal-related transcriptional regulator [Anaerolineaceae bacterium]
MSAPILGTKLYIPPPRPKVVLRPRLIERLNEGLSLGRKLTLISAPAGFGKTTLVSEWIAICGRPIAWLSLDEGDNDPARFITYLVKALQTIKGGIGEGLLAALQSPQPLQIETILTTLLNEITTIPENFLLVLDDYHSIDSQPVDQSLAFLIEHQPQQMHLLIATREDPDLPLARLRARGQCTELRAADLRFTSDEASEFLSKVMGLDLSAENIAALEARTEGWIAGLQLAAISMRGLKDTAGFIQSFTGSHRFVMDYLLEEVLHQQPESIQTFLLRTSILDRMCGPLCDAVLLDPSIPGQATLEHLERANLFIVSQDNERRWYRYHHLFGDLLRKRLGQSLPPGGIAELQLHASEWYENNDLMLEAFRHAGAANDIERAVRLMESKKMPLHLRGVATAILSWLESLPKTLLDARPALWWMQAAMLLIVGQLNGVEEKLQATEAALALAALPGAKLDDTNRRDLIGRIAAARANVAQAHAQTETIFVQGQRALEYLHPDNLADRSMAVRSMGFAYYLQGDLAEAARAYTEALSLAQAAGDEIDSTLASIRLGQIQETGNQLHLAAETYRRVLQRIDEYSPPNAPVAYLGLARICYEWNDLDAAGRYGEQSLQQARQYDQIIDRVISSELFMVHLKLARGDDVGAAQYLSQAEQTTREKNFAFRMPDIAFTRVIFHLHQGNIEEAAQLALHNDLPLMQARVLIAQGDPSAALAALEPLREQAEVKGLLDRLLRVMAVQSVALYALGEQDKAVERLDEVLRRAEPEGFIRLFVDEGPPMAQLLLESASRGIMPDYTGKLLAAFEAEQASSAGESHLPTPLAVFPEGHRRSPRPAGERGDGEPLTEPLSQRELEVLRMFKTELSGPEIARELVIALSTVRTHTKSIYSKLNVNNRRAAVKRAAELNLI